MIVGQKIKMVRELRNYTQQHVGDLLSMTQSAYSKLEKSNDIPYSTLEQLAKIFDVPIEDVICFNESLVFNLNNNKKANGLVINQVSKNEKRLYEDYIESLKSEVAHLKQVIDKLLSNKQSNKKRT